MEEKKFSSYPLSADILETLALLCYQHPTKIQEEVIPLMLDGRDVVARAGTGSGKTAAFAIPICEKVRWEENLPQALVLEPTRELAEQVKDEIFNIGRARRLKVPALFGGFPIDKQIRTLKQKTHIVVGTPGRIMDHLRRESLNLSAVSYVVIDEADLMLDMGFFEEVTAILSRLPECRMSLFSATLESRIELLVNTYMKEPVRILLKERPEEEAAITQYAYETTAENKYDIFLRILMKENPDSCMIFCGTREMVNVLFQKLRRRRIFCGMIHGEMEQRERLKTVDAFRRGAFRFLIATDVAARGMDFEELSHVIQYDFPTGKETYVHRIGRTGRNGSRGTAISLFHEDEKRMVKAVEELIGKPIPVAAVPDCDEAAEKLFFDTQRIKTEPKKQKGDQVSKGITRIAIGGGRKSKLRAGDVVGAICGIEGIAEGDIGIIDVRDSLTYVDILNDKGRMVAEALADQPIKGKIRKIRVGRG